MANTKVKSQKTKDISMSLKTQKTVVKSASKKSKTIVKAVSKPIVKTVKKETEVKISTDSLKVAVVGVDGASKGNMTLPSEVFGAKPNKILIAQAVRVYLANQRQGNASTKTRGDVVGSTRKIYRQKGTGRARHGALKAPIFVGGGVAMGPRPHSFTMDFPVRMRKAALISALSEKAQAGMIKIVDGEFSGKTKEVAKLVKTLGVTKKGKGDKILFVTDKNENAVRGAHNIGGLNLENASTLSTYGVVANKNVVILKGAVDVLKERLTAK